mmetsp:Transcript_29644/g.100771  ORF Transcript_29644/g.100771 Transcript_29644/m.100771 type:complete len:140 (+) Transcript_29644:259-678(+)
MCSFADASAKKGEAYVVSCAADGGPKFTLCVLRAGTCDSVQIDVLLGVGNEKVEFSVSGGAAKVHLTGYEVLEDNGDDDIYGDLEDGDDDDDDDDDDESSSEDEPPVAPPPKKKSKPAAPPPAPPAKKGGKKKGKKGKN